MFQKFTETARRVIFFARYEASQFGCDYIDTEHLLLGTLREDRALWFRLLKAPEKLQSIRQQVEKQFPQREKVSTSVDLPLSKQCKRVLEHAADEADRLKDEHIAPEHLLLGLLLEPTCTASKVMAENGVTASQLEKAMLSQSAPQALAVTPGATSPAGDFHDLSATARNGALNPLIGREPELERIIRILSRRGRNSPVLIGEAGVGKNALVEGLAQRIADGNVPGALAERPILTVDASSLLMSSGGRLVGIPDHPTAILYVRGLFDLAGKGAGWSVLEAIRVLEPHLANGAQCIATGTPFGLRMTVERAESLARHFEVVAVLPPDEELTIRIVSGVKAQYEQFHGVVVSDESIETAVSASRWFLRRRQLPDRAIDLIDDAAARVKLRCETGPPETAAIRKRLRLVVREMEKAIQDHEFEKARHYSEEERKERQNLNSTLEKLGHPSESNVVQPDDVVEAVAERAGVPVSAVKSLLQRKDAEQVDLVAKELAAEFPVGGREWAESLAAYLAGCSAEEAENLAQAIRTARANLDMRR